jgi:hypothetical protein
VHTVSNVVVTLLLVLLELALVVVIVAPKAVARSVRKALSAIGRNIRTALALSRRHAGASRRGVESSAEGN